MKRKEIEPFLFTDEVIVYIKKFKNLQTIEMNVKIIGHKAYTQKSTVFLYISKKQLGNEIFRSVTKA